MPLLSWSSPCVIMLDRTPAAIPRGRWARSGSHQQVLARVVADAAVRDDGLGGDTRTPLQRRQLPAARAEAGLEPRDAHLAGTDPDLGRVGAPVLEVDHRLGRADVARDDEGIGQLVLDVVD